MESDDANCDDNDPLLVALLLLVSTLAMVDSSAHFRCDLGVMECCNRIVYPPPRYASDDEVMGEETDADVVASCGDRARVADARRDSQGLRLDFCGAGLAILISVLLDTCAVLVWLQHHDHDLHLFVFRLRVAVTESRIVVFSHVLYYRYDR